MDGSLASSTAGTIVFCPALAALASQVQNIIFLTLLVPIAQKPGQAGVLGRMSLCLWFRLFYNLMHNFSISLCCFWPKLSEISNSRPVTYSTLPIVSDICSALQTFLLIDGRTEAESKEKRGVWDPMPELTINSSYVHSIVDSNTFT